MSGRVHVFVYQGVREKLEEFSAFLGVQLDESAFGHLMKEGCTVLYDEWKQGTLANRDLEEMKHVGEPTLKLERKITTFLNEGTIKRLDAMEQALGIDHFDTAHSHLLQMGFLLLYNQWKADKIPLERIEELKTVFQPKVVYHR